MESLGLKDHQEHLDLLDYQGEMDRREAKVKKEIQVREVLRDLQVWMEKLELKERRETLELVYQALLAALDLLDPPDHAVYLMDMMPLVLGLMTWTAILSSSWVLLVHQGLLDLLVPLDPNCHCLTPRRDSLLGMPAHLVHLGEMDSQANLEYRVQQEEVGLQVHLDLWERRVTKGILGHQDQRVNVRLWVHLGLQGLKGLLDHQERQAQQVPQDPLVHLDLQEPNSLWRIWRDLERVTCSLELESEAHRVPLVNLAHRVLRERMEPQELRGCLSRVSRGNQDRRVVRVLLDYQVLGGPKERKAVQDPRVTEALMDTVSQDHLGLLDFLDLSLIYRICCSMLQKESSTSQRSEDHQGLRALKACLAELDFQDPGDQRGT